jgi:hypothetical protein
MSPSLSSEVGTQPDAAAPLPKLPYSPPALVLYGQVAALTQGSTTCGANDSSSCTPGSTMGPMSSDRQLKENLARIGTHPLGMGLYLFDYKAEYRERWGEGRRFGVMADEVEAVIPEAVSLHADGYKLVDYGMLGIAIQLH